MNNEKSLNDAAVGFMLNMCELSRRTGVPVDHEASAAIALQILANLHVSPCDMEALVNKVNLATFFPSEFVHMIALLQVAGFMVSEDGMYRAATEMERNLFLQNLKNRQNGDFNPSNN